MRVRLRALAAVACVLSSAIVHTQEPAPFVRRSAPALSASLDKTIIRQQRVEIADPALLTDLRHVTRSC